MSKIFLASTFATLLCASLAAQATQTPSPNPSAPPATQQPRTGADTQQPPTGSAQSAPRSAAANTITVEGCIQRSASASATAGAAGSASSDSGFILASAMKPAGTSGSSASSSAPIASSYKLDADAGKLTPHVGHKVEISGTVQASSSSSSSASGSASSSSASAAPTLKVDNVKMIAATCTP